MTDTSILCKPHYFILTGGPGAGKTTVKTALEQKGYTCVPEVARQIIREQEATGGNAVPWKDMEAYTRLMQEQSIATFYTGPSADNGSCFYDRGIADVICHARLNRLPVDDALHTAALQCRYNEHVFMFPPWEEIYCTDAERKQTYAEAVTTYNVLCAIYREYGYTLIEAPKVPVMERVGFVLEYLEAITKKA
ncbi:AAA family ATPase [Chitinophaga agrisoli]|uniref:AAA family ATPase n=1 Tax=Chitinophaga agrisoli TaxID=2607653 RepID=A0A5B2W0L1_9BACT|nr:AAA family ATPase [Chitinophaga agrisoli]KAA2244895.1 AAA family ATPase [Chitinophaga agrisoli]